MIQKIIYYNLLPPIVNHIQNNPDADTLFHQYVCPHNPKLKTFKDIIGKKELSFVLDEPVKITAKI
ncbi:hypothetical protein [Methanothermococcus sp.]|uniref:hypothetical protein n=1 Tax=Methanothermococcus sp. TaxID=2614238 RepID=UPI0025DC335F|nr:hypothetical protein [Methanothermococcus sp.]